MSGARGTKANWASPNSEVKTVNLVQILQEASMLWLRAQVLEAIPLISLQILTLGQLTKPPCCSAVQWP